MIIMNDFHEVYPGNPGREFAKIGFCSGLERSVKEGSWGSALSLSLQETEDYRQSKGPSCLVPSSNLIFKILKNLSNNNALTTEDKQMLDELNRYWHRTSSIVAFPTDNSSGYIAHYFNQNDGKIVLDLDKTEIPPYETVAKIEDYPKFFKKLLGDDYLEGYTGQVREKLGSNVCVWIPPRKSIENSPEKIVVFGAFAEYGMGMWLTSYSKDKTLVGSRPFRLAYDLSETER